MMGLIKACWYMVKSYWPFQSAYSAHTNYNLAMLELNFPAKK